MGRISSGEYDYYGKGKEQVDLAKNNKQVNPNGSHTILGSIFAQFAPSIFMNGLTLASQLGNSDVDQTQASSQINPNQADFQQRENAVFSKLNKLKGASTITPAQFNELKQMIADYDTTYPQGGSSRLDNTTILRGIRNGSITADNIKEKLGGQKFGV